MTTTPLPQPPPPTPEQRAALDLKQANRKTLHSRIHQAIQDNRTFLNLASPTNAQNAAQLKALTRQMNGLLRLEGGELDAAD